MTQQKIEEQLSHETINNLETIVFFLTQSEQYQHQASLINNLQSIVSGKNKPSFTGDTVKSRTLEALKIAVAHTRNLEKKDGRPYSQQDKAAFLDICMKWVTIHAADLLEDTIRHALVPYLTMEERINVFQGSAFFKAVFTKEDLLSALFMGEEDLAKTIVRGRPELLFEKGTYKMPLLNQDGTPSNKSEQIYRDTTPLQLMLYTGDWKMWERIVPLIPESKLEETLQEMRNITRGGPDLVKTDRDPSTLSVRELRYYYEKDERGLPKRDYRGNYIVYDLLHNRNGLFYLESTPQARLFFVDIDPDTQEKTVVELHDPETLTPEDGDALTQFKATIRNNIARNSSLRTSDEQHALIKRVFGIELERNGIRYELNGQHYQDTYDGCIRLKNAYRRYMEIFYARRSIFFKMSFVDADWCSVVGMAQRLSMVHVNQRFCEKNRPFSQIKSKIDFQSRLFIRTDEMGNYLISTLKKIYPLRISSEIGFDFALYKGPMHWACGDCGWGHAFDISPDDLMAVRLVDEVRADCFYKLMRDLDRRLHPSSDQSSRRVCCIVM